MADLRDGAFVRGRDGFPPGLRAGQAKSRYRTPPYLIESYLILFYHLATSDLTLSYLILCHHITYHLIPSHNICICIWKCMYTLLPCCFTLPCPVCPYPALPCLISSSLIYTTLYNLLTIIPPNKLNTSYLNKPYRPLGR